MSAASVRFYLPAPPLREAVSAYYILRIQAPEGVEDIIHPEWANVRLVLSGGWRVRFPEQPEADLAEAAISGVLERGVVARGSPGVLVGFGVLPEGWDRLTGQPATAFADRLRPLSDALGPAADALLPALRQAGSDGEAVEILDAQLSALIVGRPAASPIVARAQAVLVSSQPRSVEAWAAEVGLSARQLERSCLRYLGLSPKRLLRRQRFLRTLAAMRDTPPGGWSGLIDAQYVDQSHFIREFHYYLGMSPRAYFARPQPFMREAGDQRAALLGAPVQGLHAPAAVRQTAAQPTDR